MSTFDATNHGSSNATPQATPTFVFTNNKGGVGKSTSATNVAYGLVQTLRFGGVTQPRVLLVDTDGQAHATLLTTGRNDFGEKDSLHAVLMAGRQDIVPTLQQCLVSSHWDEGLHVLPGSAWLDETENLLFSANGAPYRLAQALAPIAHSYHAIVIDTRPSYTLMTKMAILAGTDAIIPIEPRYLESVALNEAIREIIDIRDGWGYNHINISGILLTKVDKRIRGHKNAVSDLKGDPSVGKLMAGVIPANEDISYSHANHMSVMQYNPRAKASQAYARLAFDLAKRAFAKGGK
jgi:chromosome partitioning protein